MLDAPWFYWAVGVALGFPLCLVLVTELQNALRRRGSVLTRPVHLLRTYILPLGALLILLVPVVISEAMAGTDTNPAVPGYDPDISAELYTTNGDTDTHMTELYGTLGFTPEMSTCEAASNSVPDDEWVAADCGSGFEFPDDEDLVQAEFAKNIPFALSVAKSADDPDDPESVVGREAEDFRVDTFEVSYGDPQTVAVVAKRALDDLRLNYRIDGGRTRTARVSEWEGGERYGDENDDYYAELRGQVRGADPGDDVTVWFTGEEDRRGGDDDDDDDDDDRGKDRGGGKGDNDHGRDRDRDDDD